MLSSTRNNAPRKCAKWIAVTDASTKVLGCSARAIDVIFEEVKTGDWSTGGVMWSARD